MGASIARWGNSLAVRIPKSALDAADLHEGDPVTVTAEGRSLVLRRSDRVDLETMIASITAENLPDESFDFAPIGRELL
jgi:antitoxin MazE